MMNKKQEEYFDKKLNENLDKEIYDLDLAKAMFEAAQTKEAIALMSAEQLMGNELVKELLEPLSYLYKNYLAKDICAYCESGAGDRHVVACRTRKALAPFEKVGEK